MFYVEQYTFVTTCFSLYVWPVLEYCSVLWLPCVKKRYPSAVVHKLRPTGQIWPTARCQVAHKVHQECLKYENYDTSFILPSCGITVTLTLTVPVCIFSRT